MSMIEVVRAKMYEAMKSHEKERKDSLSMLLGALKNKWIDKGETELTDEEAFAVIRKEISQTKETMDLAPADRTDIKEACSKRIAVYEEFVPAEMTEEDIRAKVSEILSSLGISEPKVQDKGKIMKQLMPAVKGRADGALVNKVVTGMLK